jgi:pyruvate dehydrogenase E2 component (dihydrolipoamide acetyltransferase)
MPDFLLPDLGEGLTEAEVVEWHVAVGDHVSIDQVVVEVETAKAVVDVPVPFAGVVSALHGQPGTPIRVGAPLLSVATADDVAERPPGFAEPGVVVPDGRSGSEAASSSDEGSGAVLIGYGTSASPRRRRAGSRRSLRVGSGSGPGDGTPVGDGPSAAVASALATSAGAAVASPVHHGVAAGSRSADAVAGPAPAAPAGSRPAPVAPAGSRPAPVAPAGSRPAPAAPAGSRAAPVGPVRVISPVVRKLARDAGVDLRTVQGTGPGGLVRRSDVEQAITTTAAVPASAAAPAREQAATGPAESPLDGTRIPLRGLRRTVAEKLSRSRREIPEATVWVDVDATELLAARTLLNSRAPERPVSLLALLARFTVLALRRYPELNARVDEDEIVVLDRVHLGFAAQTERGLVVPVVRDAQALSTRDLSAALAQRTADARAGSLAPADLTGGTITVNNYGVFGVDGSAAIINHPEVAIVGMGRIIDRPWVVDGQLAVRKVSQLTLAFDHRVCDGGTAGGFLRYVADCVESPLMALGDL